MDTRQVFEDKVIEECSELIHAICKSRRFGDDNYHPKNKNLSNLEQIFLEIDDVLNSVSVLKDYLRGKYGS